MGWIIVFAILALAAAVCFGAYLQKKYNWFPFKVKVKG